MEKSLDFVKNRINNNMCTDMNIVDFENATEFSFIDFVKSCLKNPEEMSEDNELTLKISGEDIGIEKDTEIIISFNPDADFEYFASETCNCDGTLGFMRDLMQNIFMRLLELRTSYKDTVPEDLGSHFWDYKYKYIVGNFVMNTEYGNQFSSKEKPWMTSRFTVCLPIKCEYIRKD